MKTNEKVIVVTGAGSGIGRDYAIAILNQGHKVVLTGRRTETLTDTKALSSCSEDNVLMIKSDVSKSDEVRTLFSKALDKFGRIDVLFNNAGIFPPGVPFEDISDEDWNKTVDINLSGSFYCAREAFKIMKRQSPQGGRIINNGSISAQVPRPNSAAYTATKHAITGLTKSIYLDGRKYNINASQIDIGNAASEMTAKMEKGVPQADGSIAPEATMHVSHVTDALLYITDLPLDVNVLNLTVLASKMPFVGRG